MGPSRNDLLAALRADRDHSAILVDFDGTLSPIVPVAAEARPVNGAVDVLRPLAEAYGLVAVVSGRPVSFLVEHLPPTLRLVGLYGLEWADGGTVHEHPAAGAWRVVIDDAARAARVTLPAGVDVEHKGLSLTIHFRPVPDAAEIVRTWAAGVAQRTGLHERAAKMSIELHPPIGIDKGTVVRDLVAGFVAACYLGDDIGDLPAFAALDDLAAAGMHTVKVAVSGADAAPAVMDAADVIVSGPDEALGLLRSLL